MQKHILKALFGVLLLCFGVHAQPVLAYERVHDIEILAPRGETLRLRLENGIFIDEESGKNFGKAIWEGRLNDDNQTDYIIEAEEQTTPDGSPYTALLGRQDGSYGIMPLGKYQKFEVFSDGSPEIFCGYAVTDVPENGEWDSVVTTCNCYGFNGQMYFINEWTSYNVPASFEDTCPREPLREAFERGLGYEEDNEDYEEDYSEPEFPFNPGEITWHKPESYLVGAVKTGEKSLRMEGLEFTGRAAVKAELLWTGDLDHDNLNDYMALVDDKAGNKELVALTSQLDDDSRLLYSVVRLGPAPNLALADLPEEYDEAVFFSHLRIETENAEIDSCTGYIYMGKIARLFEVQWGYVDDPELICNFERLTEDAYEEYEKYWHDDSDNLGRLEADVAVMTGTASENRLGVKSYEDGVDFWPFGETVTEIIWAGRFPGTSHNSYVVQTTGLEREPLTIFLNAGENEGEKYHDAHLLGSHSGVSPFDAQSGENLCVYKYETLDGGRVRTTCDCLVPRGRPFILGNSLTADQPWDDPEQICPREDLDIYMSKLD